ncbi:MAG: acyl-CoA thioesterase [Flavobacteriales bacterium]|jgi:acyl-CoA thioesterase YciA|nr:acyl-CoA thioesterase [Flavobacteriales bacterium]
MKNQPKGELAIKVVAMPKDTNPAGDVFGGWLLSQMDLAGGVFCRKIAKGRVVTVTIESTTFNEPVFIGDTLCCYVSLVKTGKTSITVHIEAFVSRDFESEYVIKVTSGDFKYVKLNGNRKPTLINE